jgi:integrase
MNTTSAAVFDHVPWPLPSTVILRGRALHQAADTASLSRFRDEVWFTSTADVDDPRHAPSLNFTGYPAPQRPAFKSFALAVLDHERPAALLAGSPGAQASLSTLGMWVIELRLLAAWMHERAIARICDLTADDLDLYRAHVIEVAASGNRRADHLHAVRALWAYREHLPAPCRLPHSRPWGDATARHLAGHTEWTRYNKTPRIAPDTMEALLAWSLRVLEDFGPDILDARREQRELMDGTHPTSRFYREHYRGRPLRKRLEHYLPRLAAAGGVLPGQPREDGGIELACSQLARIIGCDANAVYQHAGMVTEMARQHGIAIAPDAPLGTITGLVNGQPWRDRPIGLGELDWLVKALRAALFVTICYLSGIRPGEVLRLRRGCLHQDEHGQFTVTGFASKGTGHQGGDAVERTWAVVCAAAAAIAMAESLTDSPMLFPPDLRRQSPRALTRSRPLRSGQMNADIATFIDWVNATFTRPGGAPAIPPDPDHNVHAARFRRTLAYFVVRRPGGLIAAALQYGHVRSKVTRVCRRSGHRLARRPDPGTTGTGHRAVRGRPGPTRRRRARQRPLGRGIPPAPATPRPVRRPRGRQGPQRRATAEQHRPGHPPRPGHDVRLSGRDSALPHRTARGRAARRRPRRVTVPNDLHEPRLHRPRRRHHAPTAGPPGRRGYQPVVPESSTRPSPNPGRATHHADQPTRGLTNRPPRSRGRESVTARHAPRDRDTERRAIQAAADRLLAGAPLHSDSGKLTATELITESGLRRDVVYEHRDLVDAFKGQARTRDGLPEAAQKLADRASALQADLERTKADLEHERRTSAYLRRVVTELSIELEHARQRGGPDADVIPLTPRQRRFRQTT